ncbi:MAG: cytochrome c [Sphingomonas sp.]|nr:cytochrome c [Sphingomonas sp.]
MRIVSVAAVAACLAACGGPQTSQANNSAANISNDARPAPTASASAVTNASIFDPAPSKDEAMRIHHDRHEGMEAIGKDNKIIKQELNASVPNLDLVRSTAAKMSTLSEQASGWFHAGTGQELGKSGAKPEIWQNQADVAAKLSDFQKAMKAFSQTANGSDVGAMKSQFANLAGTCKACHDKYRMEMHH